MSTTKITTQSSADQARIDRWREKQAKENPSFLYEKLESANEKNAGGTLHLKMDPNNKTSDPRVAAEIYHATMCAISGSASSDYALMLVHQTLCGFFNAEDYALIGNAINSALLAMAPADIIEAQLCARLLVLNNQIAEYMGRAASSTQTTEGRDLNLNRATKLMRVYNETLETLNKYRRKGEQRVTVQHVNVGNGGQAIVAGQFNPGEGHDKK